MIQTLLLFKLIKKTLWLLVIIVWHAMQEHENLSKIIC